MTSAQWRRLVDHVVAVPEQIYETWTSSEGWNNMTRFGKEYGENGVSWCVIFNWDMYHDVGLDAVVPKVDNVTVFSDWAKKRGQWSGYPSVGAWVNLGGGAHTELVVGFDADTVFTKGGNSVRAGAADNGQGNGVWSHATPRRSARVVGYFAPHFPDGQCPPTADPSDARGGRAVASWRHAPGTPAPAVSLAHVVHAARHDPPAPEGSATHHGDVLIVEKALSAEGLLPRQYVDGSFGTRTVDAYSAWQRRCHLTGPAADGIPGRQTLARLGAQHGFTVTA
ncbi:peptidoglycan-binding domain-containing protein [Streptomyces sp. NPDC050738]|uniref:peptidoglycan-binding domain-containing protein n=1 Tax=Streptomyces sp. NPDC050738 TaxID=3154744 RepID=UPI0034364B58